MAEMGTPDEAARIAARREEHIGRLLLRAQRGFSDRALAKLRERGHAGLGAAHTGLLPHLDLEGTRITTLAERARVTKQAAGQLVAELEERGYLTRAVDPEDRRATRVTFTDAGWTFLRDAEQIKAEIEADYTALLGAAGMATLRDALTTLIAAGPAGQMAADDDLA